MALVQLQGLGKLVGLVLVGVALTALQEEQDHYGAFPFLLHIATLQASNCHDVIARKVTIYWLF